MLTLTLDSRQPRTIRPGLRARRATSQYAAQLKKVASHIQHMLGAFPEVDTSVVPTFVRMMESYAQALEPWAQATASRMLADVNARDQAEWMEHAREMSAGMRETIRRTPVGQKLQALLREQVHLITSLPREAAQRVHELTLAGLENSTRASEIAKEIGRTGEVTASRARLIARTEVARTASQLTEARALHVGSVAYVWRTAGDGDVRPSHKEMAGKVVRWDSPPTLDGMTGHAGSFPNCRCHPEPILPDEFD